MEGVYTEFYTCDRIPYMSVHSSVYVMYTVCNRRYTGSNVEGVYTEFHSCGRVPSSSGHIAVYSMYAGRIKGYTECGVEGMCTDFVYLENIELWFLAGMKFVCGTLSGRVLRYMYANLRFENVQ